MLLLVCACEPEATPLPVNLEPAATITPTAVSPTEAQTLRYAVSPDTLAYIAPADQQQISSHAALVTLDAQPNPEDLGTQYEIAVALGDWADSTAAPSPLTISLAIDTALPPLDDPVLADIVRRAADPQQMVLALAFPATQAASTNSSDPLALRAELANAGYPDGFDLSIASEITPAADALAQTLAAINIHARRTTNPNEPAHLTLTTAQTPDATPLLTIPIRYRAVDGLTITFTPSGFPVAQR